MRRDSKERDYGEQNVLEEAEEMGKVLVGWGGGVLPSPRGKWERVTVETSGTGGEAGRGLSFLS